MRTNNYLILLLLSFNMTWAQNHNDGKIIGTFVYNKNAYNYEYIRNQSFNVQIHSFKIIKVGSKESIESIISKNEDSLNVLFSKLTKSKLSLNFAKIEPKVLFDNIVKIKNQVEYESFMKKTPIKIENIRDSLETLKSKIENTNNSLPTDSLSIINEDFPNRFETIFFPTRFSASIDEIVSQNISQYIGMNNLEELRIRIKNIRVLLLDYRNLELNQNLLKKRLIKDKNSNISIDSAQINQELNKIKSEKASIDFYYKVAFTNYKSSIEKIKTKLNNEILNLEIGIKALKNQTLLTEKILNDVKDYFLKKADRILETAVFYDFTPEEFIPIFNNQLVEALPFGDKPIDKKNDIKNVTEEVKKIGYKIFYSIQTRLDFLDDEPITAYLYLKKDEIEAKMIYRSKKPTSHILKVKDLQVEFEDGAIKNLFLNCNEIDTIINIKPKNMDKNNWENRNFLQFKNPYPISVSGKFDGERFAADTLVCTNCGGNSKYTLKINLGELLAYDIKAENDKEDFSPANTNLTLSPDVPVVELKKEKRSKILEIRAYSDFVGLDDTKPNGLIQMEANRKFNINTNYTPLPFLKFIKSLNATTINFCGSLDANFRYAKIEQNNRTLYITDDDWKDKSKLTFNINPIKLLQYQVASLNLNLNFIKLTFPQVKSTWHLISLGTSWYRNSITDSIAGFNALTNKIIHTSQVRKTTIDGGIVTFGTMFQVRPDARFGMNVSLQYLIPINGLVNKRFTLNSDRQANIWVWGVDTYLKTNDNAKLFFRFRYSFRQYHADENFSQIQLGYLFDIFKNKDIDSK